VSAPTVAVSGGAGYVGCVLVPALLAAGYRVRVLDLFLFGADVLPRSPGLVTVAGDVRDGDAVRRWLTGADAVIHLAAVSNDPSCALDPGLSTSVNVDGTRTVIEAARRAGVGLFVHASSASVYGIAGGAPVTESSTLAPITEYGTTKLAAEHLLRRAAADGLPSVALRPAAMFGYSPRLRLDLTVNLFTSHAAHRGEVTVFGGAQLRPVLHVRDLCDAVRSVLDRRWDAGRLPVFNLARENRSVRELATAVVREVDEYYAGRRTATTLSTSPSDDLRSYAVDSALARRELGFAPRRGVTSGVHELCDAFEAGLVPGALDDDRYVNVRRLSRLLGTASAPRPPSGVHTPEPASGPETPSDPEVPMLVPFVDLAVHDADERRAVLDAVDAVMRRGDYILGEEVDAFEREFADYCGARHAVGVSSGTSALVLALRALGIGAGDEVITVANSFLSTVSAILLAGARPVLVDVGDDDDENIDPDAVRRAVTPATRAVLPVHLRGLPAATAALGELAREHGLRVVEDAAQAQGARIAGRHVGTFGDIGCFSLHPLKNLPALGDAGIMITNDDALATTLRSLRNHGLAERGFTTEVGDNARLDTVQAAVLRVRMRTLEERNARRAEIAHSYDACFASLPVTLPGSGDGANVYHHYVLQVPDRPALLESMEEAGVDVRVHYPVTADRQPAFTGLVTVPEPLRRTWEQAERIVSLPCSPAMSDKQVTHVVEAIRGHYRRVTGIAPDGADPSTRS
jgi:dTDP-4-amino-4,6-dideoxygalactose transaminase/nucleoside-diphosphate-sugar epimerase